jgi:hypothetical protein
LQYANLMAECQDFRLERRGFARSRGQGKSGEMTVKHLDGAVIANLPQIQ